MNNTYWKEKYADYHSRTESKIAEIEKENTKLKDKLDKIKKVTTKCININDNLESCKDCEYDKECKAGVEHFVLKIIEGAEDDTM